MHPRWRVVVPTGRKRGTVVVVLLPLVVRHRHLVLHHHHHFHLASLLPQKNIPGRYISKHSLHPLFVAIQFKSQPPIYHLLHLIETVEPFLPKPLRVEWNIGQLKVVEVGQALRWRCVRIVGLSGGAGVSWWVIFLQWVSKKDVIRQG